MRYAMRDFSQTNFKRYKIDMVDIEGILTKLKENESSFYRDSDRVWLLKLKDCKNITDEQKLRIDQIIEM